MVVVGLAALGLIPFVLASAGMSSPTPDGGEGKLTGLVRLAYRQFSHPSLMVWPIAVAVAGVGFLMAGIAALVPKKAGQRESIGLLLVLVSGGIVVALAQLAQSHFRAASPSYNVWMLPTLALLLASGFAAAPKWARRASVVGIHPAAWSGRIRRCSTGDSWRCVCPRPAPTHRRDGSTAGAGTRRDRP